MPPCDLCVGGPERSRASDRQSVVVEGRQVVRRRPRPAYRRAPAAGQPEVGLGEARVSLRGSRRIRRRPGSASLVSAARAARNVSATHRRSSVEVGGRQRRPAGLEARLVGRRDDQDRQGADPLAIADDRLEPTAEVGQDVGRLRRAAQGRVDELMAAGQRRRLVQPVLADDLVGQAARGESTRMPDKPGAAASRAAPRRHPGRAPRGRSRTGPRTRCAPSR